MPKTYFIQLRPLNHFYFGGNHKFEEGESTNYLVRSEPYPQQTSLLGLTRFLLLQHVPKDSGLADLIGEKGFRKDNKEGYGMIESLSPVAFYKDDVAYLPLPLSYDKAVTPLDSESMIHGVAQNNVQVQVFKEKELQNYSYKDEYKYVDSNWLIGSDGALIQLKADSGKENGVLLPHDQVGIDKQRKDEAFYKLTAYRMRADFSFGFHLTLKETQAPFEDGYEQTVTLGGERSPFLMKVKAVSEAADLSLPETIAENAAFDSLSKDNLHKLLLTSDAYVDMKKLYEQHPTFVLGKTIAFRHLKTKIGTKNHQKRADSEDEGFVFSESSQLLKKGSVIYCSKSEELETIANLLSAADATLFQKEEHLLTTINAFRAIGYNHFTTFK